MFRPPARRPRRADRLRRTRARQAPPARHRRRDAPPGHRRPRDAVGARGAVSVPRSATRPAAARRRACHMTSPRRRSRPPPRSSGWSRCPTGPPSSAASPHRPAPPSTRPSGRPGTPRPGSPGPPAPRPRGSPPSTRPCNAPAAGERLTDEEIAWIAFLIHSLRLRDEAWTRIDRDGETGLDVHERLVDRRAAPLRPDVRRAGRDAGLVCGVALRQRGALPHRRRARPGRRPGLQCRQAHGRDPGPGPVAAVAAADRATGPATCSSPTTRCAPA